MSTEQDTLSHSLVRDLAVAATEPKNIAGAHFVAVPPGFTLQDISRAVEAVQPAPSRTTGAVCTKSLASFIKACQDQVRATADFPQHNRTSERGYIYADPDTRAFVAIFDDQRNAFAGWRQHRTTYVAELTIEFERWLKNSGVKKTQLDFAEFIEDNIADLADQGTALLEVATTIQAKTGINFSSAQRLDNGQTQLQYAETIDAKAGAAGAIEIPREFSIGVRLFKNGSGYKIKARLKYRLERGQVIFWYELDRPERSIEDAFSEYVTQVTAEAGIAVLIGKP